MKKRVDKLTGLVYDVEVVDEQVVIENKYEKSLSQTPEESILSAIFGASENEEFDETWDDIIYGEKE